jgi:hypothetical protein
MNTTLKHLAFNLAAAAAALVALDIAISHALAALGLFAAVGLLTIMIRNYGTSTRQLPLAPAAAKPASRALATHRLAA